jgi:enoyl-CoA hydratase
MVVHQCKTRKGIVVEVSVEHHGHVALVTYSNPPVNALSLAALLEFTKVFRELSDDRNVRAIVFTGAGERAFIAGADLRKAERGPNAEPDQVTLPPATYDSDPGRVPRESFWSMYDCSVPVVVAVNGPALGGGMAFVSMADFVVAADHARFGMTEINVGILGGGTHLTRVLGPVRARKMFFLGKQASAQEFYDWGVVDEVVPLADLLPTAMRIAETIASKSPIAMRLAKESLNQVELGYFDFKEAYKVEQNYTFRLYGYPDSAEARRAFMEKREPKWEWK